MRRPAASNLAVIWPITFFATASGLMIENVRSMAMRPSFRQGCETDRGLIAARAGQRKGCAKTAPRGLWFPPG